MTVLVTGGSGLVGKHLQEICPTWTYVSSKDCDLRERRDVEALFKAVQPHMTVHLAAKVGGIQFNIDNQPELLSENVLMNSNVLSAATNHGCRVIGILSTCIYPAVSPKYPMDEALMCLGNPQPSNYGYAVSKRTMFDHISLLNEKYGSKHCCLIPSNLYGKYDHFDPETAHFLPAIISKIKTQSEEFPHAYKAVTLWGDGSPLRQFTYAGDLAKVIKIFVERNLSDNVNVATPENLSIMNIAKKAVKIIDEDVHIHINPTKPNGQHRKDVCSDKLNRVLGYHFEYTPLDEGIKLVYDHIKS